MLINKDAGFKGRISLIDHLAFFSNLYSTPKIVISLSRIWFQHPQSSYLHLKLVLTPDRCQIPWNYWCSPMPQDKHIELKVWYYGSNCLHPVSKTVHTLSNTSSHSPQLEHLMGRRLMQPHIHDGIISIKHRRMNKISKFQIFVKNHKHLPANMSLRRWRNVQWRGDIVVIKMGKSHGLVNISPADSKLADFAVKW